MKLLPWRAQARQRIAAMMPAMTALFAAISAASADLACTLTIGPEINSFHYREPGLMKEDGLLYGAMVRCALVWHSNLFWETGASLAAGTLRYDGQTMDGEPAALNTPNRIVAARTSLGYRLGVCMPYLGLGIRDWVDDLGANSPLGYKRQTTYLYSPAGLEISRSVSRSWSLGARIEFDVFWGGRNRNSDFQSGDDFELSFRQSSGYGAQASVWIERELPRSLGLRLEPAIQYWDIRESEHKRLATEAGVYEFFEPANNTTMYALRCFLRW